MVVIYKDSIKSKLDLKGTVDSSFQMGKIRGKLDLLDEQLMNMLKTKSRDQLEEEKNEEYIRWKNMCKKVEEDKKKVLEEVNSYILSRE